jgi:hypothetical protein
MHRHSDRGAFQAATVDDEEADERRGVFFALKDIRIEPLGAVLLPPEWYAGNQEFGSDAVWT